MSCAARDCRACATAIVRPGSPSAMSGSVRRAGPHGRQEARPDPRRRWPPLPRPGSRHAAGRPRLRLRPSGRRRHEPGGLRRCLRRRARPDLCPVPARRRRVLRATRRADRADDDRQRQELHRVAGLPGRAGRSLDIRHKRTKPYRPQTNGKSERFNRTMLDEWAYARPYETNDERLAALDPSVIRTTITDPIPRWEGSLRWRSLSTTPAPRHRFGGWAADRRPRCAGSTRSAPCRRE